MRKLIKLWLLIALDIFTLAACGPDKKIVQSKSIDSLLTIKDGKVIKLQFNFSVTAPKTNFVVPGLHSTVSAYYNGSWVFIGGRKNGFHGRANNPPPFKATTANDSLWVIDFVSKKTWGVPVPANYYLQFTSTNAAFCQSASSLYFCGGFTRTGTATNYDNTTSSYFFQLNLANLVNYIKPGGNSPNFSQVVTAVTQSPFVQVTGGELLLSNNHFYLIGGQNYDNFYGPGYNGKYTNAIRKFDLVQSNGSWAIGNTFSVTDTANLHRRDLNVMQYAFNGVDTAKIYGGVFTPKDEAYLNPITITGLATGQPAITVDTMTQQTNQYACAKATMVFGANPHLYVTANLGGITYKEYDPKTQKLQIGDKGVPMPFSNLISILIADGSAKQSAEYIQLPSKGDQLLPGYMGANATFIPLPQFMVAGHPDLLNGMKITDLFQSQSQVLIGYLYGGIISLGPTSGTNARGHVPTYASSTVYEVYANIKK